MTDTRTRKPFFLYDTTEVGARSFLPDAASTYIKRTGVSPQYLYVKQVLVVVPRDTQYEFSMNAPYVSICMDGRYATGSDLSRLSTWREYVDANKDIFGDDGIFGGESPPEWDPNAVVFRAHVDVDLLSDAPFFARAETLGRHVPCLVRVVIVGYTFTPVQFIHSMDFFCRTKGPDPDFPNAGISGSFYPEQVTCPDCRALIAAAAKPAVTQPKEQP